MENHFTLHAATEEIIEEPKPKATVKCQNCGDQQLAQETHCNTCRFPLAEVKLKTITSLSEKLGRRVG
jgi:ribosomal protein L37E